MRSAWPALPERKPLLRKASDATAHVAGVRSMPPGILAPEDFFDMLRRLCNLRCIFFTARL